MQFRTTLILAPAMFLALAILLTSVVSAQSVLFAKEGDIVDDEFGSTMANAGDVDGDGYDDVITGSPLWSNGRGRVQVLSGLDGSLLHDWSSPIGQAHEYGIAVTGVGDVSLNGHADVAFTSIHPALPWLTIVRIFDGLTGALIDTLSGNLMSRFGFALAGGGDSDGDGLLELLVGEPLYVNIIQIRSGRAYLYEFDGQISLTTSYTTGSDEARFGTTIAWLGDLDGDGGDEYAVGEPNFSSMLSGDLLGRVVCFYDSFEFLWSRRGPAPFTYFGSAIARADDLDGNGIGDVFVGGYGHAGDAGLVQRLDGTFGDVLDSRVGDATGDRFGHGLAALDDLDGDGVADLAVGAPNDGETGGFGFIDPGVVHFVSGADLSTISFQRGFASWGQLGRSVVSLDDVTGDGLRDVATSATFIQLGLPVSSEPGTVFFLDPITNDAASSSFGAGTAGTLGVPTLTCSAPPRLGTTTSLELSNSSGSNELCAYFAGQLDTFTPFFGGTLYVVPTVIEYSASTAGSGSSLPLVVPQLHTLSGQRWIVQGLQIDAGAPQGISFSAPLELVFGGF